MFTHMIITKQNLRITRWALIRHSNYSAILSKIHSTDFFFGDFAHWETCFVFFHFYINLNIIYFSGS